MACIAIFQIIQKSTLLICPILINRGQGSWMKSRLLHLRRQKDIVDITGGRHRADQLQNLETSTTRYHQVLRVLINVEWRSFQLPIVRFEETDVHHLKWCSLREASVRASQGRLRGISGYHVCLPREECLPWKKIAKNRRKIGEESFNLPSHFSDCPKPRRIISFIPLFFFSLSSSSCHTTLHYT